MKLDLTWDLYRVMSPHSFRLYLYFVFALVCISYMLVCFPFVFVLAFSVFPASFVCFISAVGFVGASSRQRHTQDSGHFRLSYNCAQLINIAIYCWLLLFKIFGCVSSLKWGIFVHQAVESRIPFWFIYLWGTCIS